MNEKSAFNANQKVRHAGMLLVFIAKCALNVPFTKDKTMKEHCTETSRLSCVSRDESKRILSALNTEAEKTLSYSPLDIHPDLQEGQEFDVLVMKGRKSFIKLYHLRPFITMASNYSRPFIDTQK